jgi:hypothetical protein
MIVTRREPRDEIERAQYKQDEIDLLRARERARERLKIAANLVFGNADLVETILKGNIGPSTFSVASRVNTTCRFVCRTSLPLLRSVALYSSHPRSDNAMTTTTFRGLFALKASEAAAIPHEDRKRYRLYRKGAVDIVLKQPDVMARIANDRLAHGDSILFYRERNRFNSPPPLTMSGRFPFNTPQRRGYRPYDGYAHRR